jgi:hypothetical protein
MGQSPVQLFVVARGDGVRVHPLGSRVFALDDGHVAEWRADRFEPVTEAGLPECGNRQLLDVMGLAPNVWLTLLLPLTNERDHLLYAWVGREWREIHADLSDLRSVQPWARGRFLGIDRARGKGTLPTQNHWFITWDPAGGVPEIADCGDPERTTRVSPDAMIAFPSGAVFVAGDDRCAPFDPTKHGAAIERWGADWRRDHEVADLVPDGWFAALAGSSDDDVFASGGRLPGGSGRDERAYLTHFDGRRWTPVETPLEKRIESLAMTADGTLWLVHAGGVLTRAKSGAWARVALPADTRASGVRADGGDVWVEAGNTLLSTRRAREVFAFGPRCPSG